MYLNHQILNHNNINVYSVKTDAFTIDANNLELAKSLLNFDNGIGSWRLSQVKDIAYPKVKFNKKTKKCILKLGYQTMKLIG
jgi:hypothetical protein